MSHIRRALDSVLSAVEKNKRLRRLKPVFTALDSFLYGTAQVTALPHFVDYMDIKRYMSFVIIALMPATVASAYFWGWRAVLMILISYLFGGIVEVSFAVSRKKEIHEGFLVTGLIFPLTLPPGTPLWMVAVGVVFGTLFGKEVFGGTGRNIFNPAIAGRIFLTIAFPQAMTTSWTGHFFAGMGGFLHFKADAITSATPLAAYRNEQIIEPLRNLLFGNAAGCLGETFRIGLIFGGIFLIAAKISDWRIPVSYLASAAAFSFIGHAFMPAKFAPPLLQLFGGGLLLGAFFMVTDPVTSPWTKKGRLIGGVLLGFLTVLIRGLSGYVEGVMFGIVMLNMFTPLIDHMVLSAEYRKPRV